MDNQATVASNPLQKRAARWIIRGGGFESKEDLVAAVEAAGHGVSEHAMQITGHKDFVLMADSDSYEVLETTVKELTGKDLATTTELYETRNNLEFDDAPYETSLLVRIQYNDQPIGSWMYTLSKPVADADGNLGVLIVGRDSDGSWVYGRYAYPDGRWDSHECLLVCRKLL